MNRQEALKKAAKLLSLANSDNAHEAALAAARAQEILAAHDLTEAMLSLDGGEQEPEEDIVDFGTKGAPLYEGSSSTWKDRLALGLCSANGCKLYSAAGRGGTHLVGRPSDADRVRYLFAFLVREIDRLTERDGKGCGKVWRNNFRLGAAETVIKSVRESLGIAADRAREAVVGDSTALVRVEQAIEKVQKKAASVEAWAKANMKLRAKSGPSSTYDHSAREQGRRAGAEIRINSARGALT